VPQSSSFARHFPTFYWLYLSLAALLKWLWKGRREIGSAWLITVLAVIALRGFLEYWIGPQRNAVAAITQAGGTVTYDWEWKNGAPLGPGAKPPWPDWVVNNLGPDFCGNVVAVHIARPTADDALMKHIGRLKRLEYLTLYGAILSNEGFAQLEHLRSLETLTITNFAASADNLAHLAGLTRLKRLALGGGGITNEGLSNLAQMRGMESLSLVFTGITSLKPIHGMTRLQSLDLTGSPIDDEALEALEDCTSLQLVLLRQTRVTEKGIARMQRKLPLAQIIVPQIIRFTPTLAPSSPASSTDEELPR
jgi:hypothetical protein